MKIINNLLDKYKEVSIYDDSSVNADILFSYFEYKLKENKINPKPVIIEVDGEVTYSEYPPDLWCMSDDLEKIFRRYDIDFELKKCTEKVVSPYKAYCNEYYTSKVLNYFDNFTLQEVLKKSEIRKKWDEKFSEMEKAKKSFFNLKIVQKEIYRR